MPPTNQHIDDHDMEKPLPDSAFADFPHESLQHRSYFPRNSHRRTATPSLLIRELPRMRLFATLCMACVTLTALLHIMSLHSTPLSIFSAQPTVFRSWSDSSKSVQSSAEETSFTPFVPPSYPLAVRNPYISTWLPGSAAEHLPFATPQFWAGSEMTWGILARVDNETYSLFGVPHPWGLRSKPATVLGAHFTSTRTVFKLLAANVNFELEFFSPVSPKNYLRQSLPFSYLKISASVLHGSKPSIQIYSDIDERWTGQSGNTIYDFEKTGHLAIYQVGVGNGAEYTENYDMAQWGRVIWAATNKYFPLYAATGPVQDMRGQFARDGYLRERHTPWRTGGQGGFNRITTVAAFAQDLGVVTHTASTTFAIGHVRLKAIRYLETDQTHFYRHKYPTTNSAVIHFFEDYEDALEESSKLDKAIEKAGRTSGGKKYAEILALSTRQIMGGIDITIPYDTLDATKPFAFIKECSSNGNLNTVDIIFPTFPFFYVFAPDLIRLMLEPIMVYLDSGRYRNNYMIHDLGSHYPVADGHDDLNEEQMPLEESGNLLILANAYTRASNDKSFLDKYFHLMQKYANYLVDNGLYPAYQLSTNDAFGALANQTNLAIKAAVGLGAWGQLTSQSRYTKIGREYAKVIYEVGTDHQYKYFKLAYDRDSWFMVFNLYPDKLLGLDIFSNQAHQMVSDNYPTVRGVAGVSLGGAFKWAKTDWQFFAAGGSDDKKVRQMFIDDLWTFLTNGLNIEPLADRYWADDDVFNDVYHIAGLARNFRARPTLGAHFAILAREIGPNLAWDD